MTSFSQAAPGHEEGYRGTSFIRNQTFLGPCSRTMPRALWWFEGRVLFLMSEIPLYESRQIGRDWSSPFSLYWDE